MFLCVTIGNSVVELAIIRIYLDETERKLQCFHSRISPINKFRYINYINLYAPMMCCFVKKKLFAKKESLRADIKICIF